MIEQLEAATPIIAEIGGVLGAVIATAFGVYKRWVKPWANRIDERTLSVDNAVNHGRMERVEKRLIDGDDRMDRIEGRMDQIEKRIDINNNHTSERLNLLSGQLGGLEDGQREMLTALQDHIRNRTKET